VATSNISLTATNSYRTSSAATLVLTVSSAVPTINSTLTASGIVGAPFTYQMTATSSPTSFSATGLPAGLSVNTTTGLILGTPTAAGTSNISLSATNANGTGSIATLVLTVTTSSDTNVGLNQTATASTFQTGYPASYANDGSTSTRWTASSGSVPQWWEVDLGSNKTLSRVDINWYSNASRYSQYVIETSTDNVNWTTVVNKSGNTTVGATSDGFTATARYVQVNVSAVSSGYVSAYEIGVYGH
jgi:hypothetical protein